MDFVSLINNNNNMGKFMIARLFFLMALLLGLPTHTWAVNLFEPTASDESLVVLGSMFGKLDVFGSLSDGFMESMAIFNSAVMIVGGVLLIYSLVVGTIGTAHDGEMMGKKYSSVWIPLRTVIATALVLPVIQGSYCLMQVIVGWLILQGVGLADAIWEAYLSGTSLTSSATMGIADAEYKKAAWDMFGSAICMHAYQKINDDLIAKGGLMEAVTFEIIPFNTLSPSGGSSVKTWNFGVNKENGIFKKNTCGNVTYDLSAEANDSKVKAIVKAANKGSSTTTVINETGTLALQQTLINSNKNGAVYTETFINSVNLLAANFVANPSISPASIEGGLHAASQAYAESMKGEAQVLLNNAFKFDELKKNAAKEGWFLAGAWYMKIVNIMDVANAIMNMGPKTTGTNGIDDDMYRTEFLRLYKPMLDLIAIQSNVTMGIAENTEDIDISQKGSGTFSMMKTLTKAYFNDGMSSEEVIKTMFKSTFGYFVIQKEDHPMMVMKSMGDYLFRVASGILGGFIVLSSLAEKSDTIKSFKEFFVVIMMIFLPLCIGLGFTLNFVMPMMPFMIWLGCILAWLILCVEAIVAAPMWAVMHLSMSGDDMVGTGAQGYKLVLSLMLRPALMIFGFIASVSIVHVMGQFINRVFLNVYLLSQQDFGWMTMIFGLLAVPVLYLGTMWVLIIRSMNIVHQIPDQLLQWFGGGGSQLGEAAQSVGGLQSQAFAATAATAGVVKSLPNAVMQYGQQRFQHIQNQAATRSAEQGEVNQMGGILDKKAGSGASELSDKVMAGDDNEMKPNYRSPGTGNKAQKDQRAQQRAMIGSRIENNSAAISANPESSKAVAQFNKNVKSHLDANPKHTLNEAVNANFSKAFDQENGEGAFEMAKKISGTDNIKNASELISNEKFRSVASGFTALSGSVSQAGGNSGKVMSEAIKTVSQASPLSTAPEKLAKITDIIQSQIKSGDITRSQMRGSSMNNNANGGTGSKND